MWVCSKIAKIKFSYFLSVAYLWNIAEILEDLVRIKLPTPV